MKPHFTNTNNPIDFPKSDNKMNERIRELYIQTAYETADGKEWAIGGMENAERFAQLIVRECIEKITTYDLSPGHSAKWEDIYDIHARLLQDLGEELKQHFGVE
jgi:hypothetical protein